MVRKEPGRDEGCSWDGCVEGPLGGSGTVPSPPLAGASWGACLLILPSAVCLPCVVLSVYALFCNRNFCFNESTWGLYYLQSFQNLAWGEGEGWSS